MCPMSYNCYMAILWFQPNLSNFKVSCLFSRKVQSNCLTGLLNWLNDTCAVHERPSVFTMEKESQSKKFSKPLTVERGIECWELSLKGKCYQFAFVLPLLLSISQVTPNSVNYCYNLCIWTHCFWILSLPMTLKALETHWI